MTDNESNLKLTFNFDPNTVFGYIKLPPASLKMLKRILLDHSGERIISNLVLGSMWRLDKDGHPVELLEISIIPKPAEQAPTILHASDLPELAANCTMEDKYLQAVDVSTKEEANRMLERCIKHNIEHLGGNAYYEVKYKELEAILTASLYGFKRSIQHTKNLAKLYNVPPSVMFRFFGPD